MLFLGDLDSNQLKQVANHLVNHGNTHYITIITPHHGTHWHNSLKKLSAIYALSSVGEKLFAKINQGFKSISNICLYTYANGEIEVPHPVLQPLRFCSFPYPRCLPRTVILILSRWSRSGTASVIRRSM